MTLEMIDADTRAKQTRLSDIRKRFEAHQASASHEPKAGGTNWTWSAFCEDAQHNQCSWTPCQCPCHATKSLVDPFDYCGHC